MRQPGPAPRFSRTPGVIERPPAHAGAAHRRGARRLGLPERRRRAAAEAPARSPELCASPRARGAADGRLRPNPDARLCWPPPCSAARLARAADAAATGAVHGSVQLLRKSLLRGLRESDDRSGVVVYVTGFTSDAPKQIALLQQRNESFEPRVLPVVQGQTVSFPNLDRIYHNVFSVSPLASFDLGQYKSTRAAAHRRVRARRAGAGLLQHPSADALVRGRARERRVRRHGEGRSLRDRRAARASDLVLNAWLPGAKRVSQPLRVEPGQTLDVALRVEQSERIAPHKRKDGSDYPPKPGYDD